jgi:formylglycine-generating enzyme required for sulfatase activity
MQRLWFRRRYRWLIPALFALVIFIGSLTGNLITSGMDDFVERNRLWLWIITGLAGLAAVAVAAWDARHPEESAIKPGLGEIDRHKALTTRYLTRMVVERVQHLPLRGVDFKTASAETGEQERLGMADVYIALDTTSREPQEMGAATRREEERPLSALKALVLHRQLGPTRREEERPLSALKALVFHQQLVLLGGPGSGKSTFVNHLAYCLAMEALDPKGDWLARLPEWPQEWRDLLPVPITLREVAAWFQETQPPQRQAGLFQTYLAYRLAQAGVDDGYDLVCEHLRMGRAILLLDGLDEIPLQDDTLSRIKEMIADLPNAYEKTPILVTCRVLSYEDKRWQLAQKEWPTVELAMLDEEKIDRFIRAWYTQLARMAVVGDAAGQIARLSQAVRRPDLWRLAGNPLLLTVMAHVHTDKGELPDTRTLLYEHVVDLLLWRWEAINKLQQPDGRETTWRRLLQAAELTDMDMKQALWKLAYQVHSQHQVQEDEEAEATADIAESQLLATLRELHPERSLDWAETMVQIMKVRAGLLVEGLPQVYSFPHRTFQEYLAGSYLSSLPDFTTQALTLAQSGAYWRETILLAVGRLVHVVGAIDPPLMLINELCPASGLAIQGDEAWRNVWLAGESLLEVGLTRARRRTLGEELVERVPGRLATLVSHGHLSPRERARAGSVLGAIGDPRDLDEMVPVPAGEFLMGSDKSRDKDAYDDELPQHSLFVDSFRISKYPVTNGQYARFVAATGHPAPGHWKATTPPPELTNHPVVYVSWHDAVAYCGWLSKQRGTTVRLPTEAEWEKAARGLDGRIYPWGDDFDPDRLNMDDTGIGTTSPVGMFHWGASPYGCLDMAGNVWEWTQSLWGKDVQKPEFGYPYNPNDGRENIDAPGNVRRVLRGGSFFSYRLNVRCASRNGGYLPDGRLDYVGFRVLSPGL